DVDEIFFFFQAEDGIRDWSVTGVQTCALPIFSVSFIVANLRNLQDKTDADQSEIKNLASEIEWSTRIFEDRRKTIRYVCEVPNRSEERRVGKECRSRWWRYE